MRTDKWLPRGVRAGDDASPLLPRPTPLCQEHTNCEPEAPLEAGSFSGAPMYERMLPAGLKCCSASATPHRGQVARRKVKHASEVGVGQAAAERRLQLLPRCGVGLVTGLVLDDLCTRAWQLPKCSARLSLRSNWKWVKETGARILGLAQPVISAPDSSNAP